MIVALTQKDFDRFVKAMDAEPVKPKPIIMGHNHYGLYRKDPKKYIKKLSDQLFKP